METWTMIDDKDFPAPDDLGEGPERRMEKFPKPPPGQEGLTGGAPGIPKPKSADAVGDDDTEELVEEMDDEDLREREQNAQQDNARVEKKKPSEGPGLNPGPRTPSEDI
jgi:hypothetical protein